MSNLNNLKTVNPTKEDIVVAMIKLEGKIYSQAFYCEDNLAYDIALYWMKKQLGYRYYTMYIMQLLRGTIKVGYRRALTLHPLRMEIFKLQQRILSSYMQLLIDKLRGN